MTPSPRIPARGVRRWAWLVVLTGLSGLFSQACGRSKDAALDLLPAAGSGQIEVPVRLSTGGRLELSWRWDWETTTERRKQRIRAAQAAVEVWFQPSKGVAVRLARRALDPEAVRDHLELDLAPLAGQVGLLRCAVKRVKPGWVRWQEARVLSSDALEGLSQATGAERQTAPGLAMRPNVVVLLIDTLRADALGFEGGQAPTPYLDRLASEGTSFPQAYSTSSWTRTSVASLFSGLYPSSHRVMHKDSVLPETALTLAERFRLLGYDTISVFANRHIDAINGFDQGFRHYRPVVAADRQKKSEKFGRRAATQGHAAAEEVYREALSLLREERDRSTPVLLYVHTVDPHSPYDPPVWLLDEPRPDLVATPELQRRLNEEGTSEEQLQDLKTLYDASVAYADHAFGAFWAGLATELDLDNTIVFVTADHGEAFGEHGRLGHGLSLFDEEIRIPLLVWGPGRVPAGRRDPRAASLVDIPQTALALAGFAPSVAATGRDLSSQWSESADQEGSLAVEPAVVAQLHLRSSPVTSLRSGRWKLLRDDSEEAPWLFDLGADPGETLDLAATEEDRLAELSSAWSDFEKQIEAAELEIEHEPAPLPSQEVIENLRALGYIQ